MTTYEFQHHCRERERERERAGGGGRERFFYNQNNKGFLKR